jgi:hypothetical protein
MSTHTGTDRKTTKTARQAPATATPLLPQERSQALMHLIRLTQGLSALADKESQALARDDMLTFSVLQDEKELLANRYVRASEEFRNRLEDFRGADPTILDRLVALQKDLGEKTADNNQMISRIYQKARKTTQSALVTVQELAQRHKLSVEEIAPANTEKQEG